MGESLPAVTPSAQAFVTLVTHAQGPLIGFVRGLLGDVEEARDVVQEVFVDAWRAVENAVHPFVEGDDEASARRWLFHVAFRRAISVRRHRSVIRMVFMDPCNPPEPLQRSTSMSFEDQVAEGDLLRAALATLESEDAACVLLAFVYDFKSVEIAQILGIKPDAARKRLSRAMQQLRKACRSRVTGGEEWTADGSQ